MFITGPDVVKTVTGEDVTQGEARRHDDARLEVGRRDVRRRERGVLSRPGPPTSCRSCRRTTWRNPPVLRAERTDPDRRCEGIVDLIPDVPNKPYDMKQVVAEVVDDGDFFEVHQLWAMNIVCGFACRHRRPRRRASSATSPRSSPARSTSTPRRRRPASVPDLRRVQRAARDLRRRAGVPARHRPGVRRDHPARRQAALRGPRSRPCPAVQIVTRKAYGGVVRGHELQVDRRRPRVPRGRRPRSRSWGRRAR